MVQIKIVAFSYKVKIKLENMRIPIHAGNFSFSFISSCSSLVMFYLFNGGGLGNFPFNDKLTKSIILTTAFYPAQSAMFSKI
jgi:hypothetical protein